MRPTGRRAAAESLPNKARPSAVGEWKVTVEGFVRVRSAPNPEAEIIGRRDCGDVVTGVARGSWLELVGHEGFMLTAKSGLHLLKRLEVGEDDIDAWKVVVNGFVRIRKEADVEAEVLGRRVRGETVYGRVHGEWLELTEEPGFILLKRGPMLLLRRVDRSAGVRAAAEARQFQQQQNQHQQQLALTAPPSAWRAPGSQPEASFADARCQIALRVRVTGHVLAELTPERARVLVSTLARQAAPLAGVRSEALAVDASRLQLLVDDCGAQVGGFLRLAGAPGVSVVASTLDGEWQVEVFVDATRSAVVGKVQIAVQEVPLAHAFSELPATASLPMPPPPGHSASPPSLASRLFGRWSAPVPALRPVVCALCSEPSVSPVEFSEIDPGTPGRRGYNSTPGYSSAPGRDTGESNRSRV